MRQRLANAHSSKNRLKNRRNLICAFPRFRGFEPPACPQHLYIVKSSLRKMADCESTGKALKPAPVVKYDDKTPARRSPLSSSRPPCRPQTQAASSSPSGAGNRAGCRPGGLFFFPAKHCATGLSHGIIPYSKSCGRLFSLNQH